MSEHARERSEQLEYRSFREERRRRRLPARCASSIFRCANDNTQSLA
jgi:hypothetical protein